MQWTKGTTISIVISAPDLMELKKSSLRVKCKGFSFTNIYKPFAYTALLGEIVSKVNWIFNQTDHLRFKQMFKEGKKNTGMEVKNCVNLMCGLGHLVKLKENVHTECEVHRHGFISSKMY